MKALRAKDDQIVKQRNDMNASHDDIMRKREEEFKRKEDELNAIRADLKDRCKVPNWILIMHKISW